MKQCCIDFTNWKCSRGIGVKTGACNLSSDGCKSTEQTSDVWPAFVLKRPLHKKYMYKCTDDYFFARDETYRRSQLPTENPSL